MSCVILVELAKDLVPESRESLVFILTAALRTAVAAGPHGPGGAYKLITLWSWSFSRARQSPPPRPFVAIPFSKINFAYRDSSESWLKGEGSSLEDNHSEVGRQK